jgi:hypothetical protein
MRSTKSNNFRAAIILGLCIAATLVTAAITRTDAATLYPAGSLLQPGDVTSSHIRDNTIVNVDINSSAAVAYSKLNLSNALLNADINSAAGIVDTKLATISTAGKVSGAALTSLSSIPSGAGFIPVANLPNTSTLSATVIMGEPMAAYTPVFVATSTAYSKDEFDTAVTLSDNLNVGDVGARTRGAESFTETSGYAIDKIKVTLSKIGTPADNLVVAIQADSAGAPSGSDLATGSIAGGSVTGSAVEYTLTLSSSVLSTANTKFWIIFRRSGANDGSNYFNVWGDQSSPAYANGAYATYNGSTWTVDSSSDAGFKITTISVIGRAYKTTALSNWTTDTFMGFTTAVQSAADAATIATDGVLTGFAGLSPGMQYYLANATGTIASSAGTASRKVGIAASSTALKITNIW